MTTGAGWVGVPADADTPVVGDVAVEDPVVPGGLPAEEPAEHPQRMATHSAATPAVAPAATRLGGPWCHHPRVLAAVTGTTLERSPAERSPTCVGGH